MDFVLSYHSKTQTDAHTETGEYSIAAFAKTQLIITCNTDVLTSCACKKKTMVVVVRQQVCGIGMTLYFDGTHCL